MIGGCYLENNNTKINLFQNPVFRCDILDDDVKKIIDQLDENKYESFKVITSDTQDYSEDRSLAGHLVKWNLEPEH